MKTFIITVVLASFVAYAYTRTCEDSYPSDLCEKWQRNSDYCQRSDAYKKCKKTCGGCMVITIVTNSPPTGTCEDSYPSDLCEKWQRNSDYCLRSDAYKKCKKTCGGCNVLPTNPPPTGSCGRSTVAQSRIVNGVNAVPGAWPWIASLQQNGGHYCGATLLTPKWIVTASHCVSKITKGTQSQWTIKLGAHDHRRTESSVQTIKIKKVTMHPSYNSSTLKEDIAMIELAAPARLNNRVTVACLPKGDVYPALGKQCYIAGWGSVAHPGPVYHTLQQTKLPVVSSASCEYNNEVVCVGKGFKNQPNGKQQPNACRGDSGGPLVCQQPDGRWQLEGVASFVYTYCKYYTGYSPVNKYLDWINSFITS